MVYSNDFKGEKLSALGFGTMRLPIVPDGKSADIDQEQLDKMVDYAIEHGVNYFDTAYPYHEGASELAIGKSLSRYSRDKFNLATKYPGHQISSSYNPQKTFEDQLKKCQVDYFDYYLLHNVNNSSISTYLNPELKIPEFFIEMKKQGKIRHLGFSCHGDMSCIEEILNKYGDELEFCQIQLNYLDWTLQKAKEKYEMLTSRGIGVWVMEPCRGGKLSKIPDDLEKQLAQLRPGQSTPSWAFRFLQGLSNVKMVLSGMSSLDQMIDNCNTFEERLPLNDNEEKVILSLAESLKNAVPCTGCRYCCDGCPQQIDIPKMIALYNDYQVYPSVNVSIALSSVKKERMPSACIGCGQCTSVCPQGIDVASLMIKMDECFQKIPSWEEICRQREEAANRK